MIRKYMYLPDKNGNITKCGAQDHNNCPYHLGPDGKPLKHYATPEEARKAYEAEQSRNHKTSGLSKKKAGPKYVGFKPGASGIDDKFIPPRYRGLSMEDLEKKLDGNLARENRERQKLISSRTSEKVMDMERKLGIGLSPAEPIEHMNDEILDYKRRVYQVFNGLQKEADECDGDVNHSREMLRRLENTHPGADYGSKDEDDDTVCANASAYLETRMRLLDTECGQIEPMNGTESYENDRKDLIAHETAINNLIDGMKGITGSTIPGDHIQVGPITDPNNRNIHDYQEAEERKNREQAMKDNPEYAELVNKMNGEADRLQMIQREADKDSWFKKDLDRLKGMKPLKGAKSKEALDTIILKAHPWSRNAIRNDCKAIAMSDDTGCILVETPNGDNSAMEYDIYKDGSVMGLSLTNYDDIGTNTEAFFGFHYYPE